MTWVIKIHRDAKKFWGKLDENNKNKILNKLKELIDNLEKGIINWRILKMKKLKGKLNGLYRIRVGNIRIIFEINTKEKVIYVTHIHYRSKVYKKF